MSAPHIPNLLSLRPSRGGAPGGRGRARGGHSQTTAGPAHDVTIQGTDTDAAVSRLSAVDVGYLYDPYARYFVSSIDGPPPRRLPIINRGTYTRTAALDILVNSFLSGDHVDSLLTPRQIVSLGAGTDTRPFRLFSNPTCQGLIYHEIDFEVISRKKLRIVQGNPLLANILANLSASEDGDAYSWSSRPSNGVEYHCHGLDLRQFSEPADIPLLPGLRTDIPTLLISECCLCYLLPEQASSVLNFFTSQIPSLATVIYEPIRPNDAFGQVMVSNLASRRIRMPTLDSYPEPQDQKDRLQNAGFELVRQMTIGDIWKTWVTPQEKERVNGLEGLDEVEEWQLLAAHYIIVWGSEGNGFDAWEGLGGGA